MNFYFIIITFFSQQLQLKKAITLQSQTGHISKDGIDIRIYNITVNIHKIQLFIFLGRIIQRTKE